MLDSFEALPSLHERLELMFRLTSPAIRQAARSLPLSRGSHGLDAGCGAGCHTDLLLRQIGASGRLTGLDISAENLAWAGEHHGGAHMEGHDGAQGRRHGDVAGAVEWVQGDLRELPFADESFDWVWCADTLWPGAVVDNPGDVLEEFKRVIRPGGTIALLYWSGQTLLPGHAELEARLNAAFVGTVSYLAAVAPELHYLRAQNWLRQAELESPQAKTFVAQVAGPVEPLTRRALAACYSMFWADLADSVSSADWAECERLCDPKSVDFIADVPGYYAFLTYTMFWASRPS